MPDTLPPDRCAEIARGGAWFAGLPAGLAEALLGLALRVTLAPGQRLFARGDAPDGLYCLVQGTVRITMHAPDGQEALLAMLEPPQWFGEIAVFDGAPRTHDAWAEGACTLLRVPQAPLLALLDAQPQHWRPLGQLLSQKLRLTFAAVEEIALLPPTQRLASRLLILADGYGAWQDRSKRVLKVSQEQLALMLSLSRQTINQCLGELEAAGALRRQRGAIEIVDADRLRAARSG